MKENLSVSFTFLAVIIGMIAAIFIIPWIGSAASWNAARASAYFACLPNLECKP